jgi:hypothetical protein
MRQLWPIVILGFVAFVTSFGAPLPRDCAFHLKIVLAPE